MIDKMQEYVPEANDSAPNTRVTVLNISCHFARPSFQKQIVCNIGGKMKVTIVAVEQPISAM